MNFLHHSCLFKFLYLSQITVFNNCFKTIPQTLQYNLYNPATTLHHNKSVLTICKHDITFINKSQITYFSKLHTQTNTFHFNVFFWICRLAIMIHTGEIKWITIPYYKKTIIDHRTKKNTTKSPWHIFTCLQFL